MAQTYTVRSMEELRARFNEPSKSFLGFDKEALGTFLPECFKDNEAGDKHRPLTVESVLAEARSYLVFAFDKAINHRGISASRSVEKMTEFCWLLNHDLPQEPYPNYGVPILKKAAAFLDVELPPEIAAWEDGQPCEPGCNQGCGK